MIVVEDSEKSLTFGDIRNGTAFWWERNLYIKLSAHDSEYNAAKLRDGYLSKFHDDEEIRPGKNLKIMEGE